MRVERVPVVELLVTIVAPEHVVRSDAAPLLLAHSVFALLSCTRMASADNLRVLLKRVQMCRCSARKTKL